MPNPKDEAARMIEPTLSVAEAIEAFADTHFVQSLNCRYAEPWRHYHAMEHPAAMKDNLILAVGDGVRIVDGATAIAFILWHDAIYDPQAVHGRNEALSAELCSYEFGTVGHPTSVGRACEAILATIGHRPPDLTVCPDIYILLDIDLAILGSDPATFSRYDAGIRAEYIHVPEEIYVAKRREVLTSFLKRDRLYLTDWACDRWEETARTNLEAAITT